ncbi:MAG: hypothetical protein ACPGOV_17125 [Magnetovibrionaceae bacterium]
MSWWKALVAAVPLLAACDQGLGVVQNYDRGKISYGMIVDATKSGGPMKLVIKGNPFDATDQALEQVLIERLTAASQHRVIQLSTQDPVPVPTTKLIMVVNAAPSQNAQALCDGSAPLLAPPPSSDSHLHVRGVLCGAGELLRDVEGAIKGATGPDDARFRKLIYDMGIKLLKRA